MLGLGTLYFMVVVTECGLALLLENNFQFSKVTRALSLGKV